MHTIDSKIKLYSFELYDELIEFKSSYDLLQSLIRWRILSKTKYYIKDNWKCILNLLELGFIDFF